MTAAALTFSNVNIEYASRVRAVRNVSFAVYQGECLALVGESGCGKTSMALAALGLLPSGAKLTGSIRVADTEIVGTPANVLRHLRGLVVGFVAQDPFEVCNPLDRVEKHVAEAWRAHGSNPQPGAVETMLGNLGIENASVMMRCYPHQWSGGMLQRATIAAASAHRPSLVIADEPTSALDADLANITLTALRNTGATILLISHDIGVVARHASRVAVVYAGRIVEIGATKAVLDRPRHPYTSGLLKAIPRPGAGLPESLPGSPPRMVDFDSGCAFAPRCRYTEPTCRVEVPVLNDGVACPVSPRQYPGYFRESWSHPSPGNGAILLDQRKSEPHPAVQSGRAFVAEARNVSKTYGKDAKTTHAVVNASLRVRAGEVVGICGPSGCGKSTFLRLLATIEPPDDGQVYFSDQLVAAGTERRITHELARSGYVAAVFQDPLSSLDRRWPLWRTVTEPLLARQHLSKAARRTKARDVLREVELSNIDVDARPDELSVGQCQRISIARALITRPSLLVADEPTSALDASISAAILHLLAGATASGTAIVMVSHDHALLRALCQRIVTMHNGVMDG